MGPETFRGSSLYKLSSVGRTLAGHLYNTLDNAGTRMPTVAPVVLQVRA